MPSVGSALLSEAEEKTSWAQALSMARIEVARWEQKKTLAVWRAFRVRSRDDMRPVGQVAF
ncbi:hypothetical protein DV096_18945 [Bradymonadaceae bacterium TMQ3]|nr:hypothetical protein DV096_18945 [Bradymonadaceae bacterium TMQ3]